MLARDAEERGPAERVDDEGARCRDRRPSGRALRSARRRVGPPRDARESARRAGVRERVRDARKGNRPVALRDGAALAGGSARRVGTRISPRVRRPRAWRARVPVFDRWAAGTKTEQPELREPIEKTLRAGNLASRYADDVARVRAALAASLKTPRDAARIVHGTRGRGKKRQRRG